ncbi:MAG: hypothetical protein DHS20C15_23990 [Planctomycetota bacterium]|nr:MAG: hypothetical protein DHS20C15_23990 [Planctomycetota bacterium]
MNPAPSPVPQHPALAELLGQGAPTPEAIDSFLAAHEFPLVEDDRVTFLWRGQADEVRLQHFIFALETSQPFERVEGSDLWQLRLELPQRSRVEYKLFVRTGEHKELVRDPLNDKLAHDPYGANSVCQSAGYEVPEWSHEDPDARPGEVRERLMHSEALGGERRVRVYLPARYRDTRRYPLLIAHDGTDTMNFAALKTVLDNLIHRHEIPPMIVALSDPGDRLVEYAADPRHATFLADELLPALQSEYPLIDRPAARGLMGASFGAVASLSTAWMRQGLFGRLLLQSGSFAFTDIGESTRPPVFDPVVEFVNAFRETPGKPTQKAFVSCGTYESLIYENRSLVPVLQEAGLEVKYVEARDGHNWENWRDRLREGLSWLFPGPLGFVYE